MTGRHFLAYGPYNVPQNVPHGRTNHVQLVEQEDGTFVRYAPPPPKCEPQRLMVDP